MASGAGAVVGLVGGAGAAVTVFKAEAVAVHLEDVNVVGKAIEQCAGEPFRAEGLGPFLEGKLLVTRIEARS